MDMDIKKELMVQDIMERCDVDHDTAETLFDCEVEAYAEKNKIEDMEAAEALYLLDDSREEKAEKPRRVYNNVDRCELEMLQGAFITAVDAVEKDDRVFLDAVKVENGKLIHLGFVLDDEGVFLNFEE
ncbi:MAG: hypothetical protein KH441_07950 [Clostridium sp.]|nr:hypothetical protein [Clostridium sp.]